MNGFDHADAAIIVVASIGACGALAVALVNTFGIRKSRRVANVAAYHAQIAAAQMDTGNDKKLGATVHDIAQTVEVISAQIHTNTTEILAVSEKLERHLEEVAPLIEKAKKR